MKTSKLRLNLLGGVRFWLNDTAVTGFASRKAEALLVYLACNPRPHPRETIATLLWPANDHSRALANLSVALSSLRKQLAPYLLTDRHTVAFNTAVPHEIDAALFTEAITQANDIQQARGKLTRAAAAQLDTAVTRYKGDFLAGFNLRHTPDFEAWTLLEQERLRQLLLNALSDLVAFHHQRGQLDEAIRYAQRLLSVDPLQETMHRQLMMIFAQDNQRPAALAQYEQCQAILAAELGVEPDEETSQLYEHIAAGEWPPENDNTAVVISTLTAETDSPRHNLPTPANSFMGREAELAHIARWLADPHGRVLSLVGPGGIGKSRLAQEAARAHIGHFAQGVWYVSLFPATSTNDVLTTLADTLQLTLSGTDDPATQLLTHLQTQETLLILDNLEHLLTSDLLNFLTRLTAQAPDVRLLITSRERLRLQAESLLTLSGLPFPDAPDMDGWTEFAAVQLFTARVQQVQPTFSLAEQATAVVALCQLVGGLPLALELAATWTRVLSVADITAEIERGLDRLTATLHDLPARHRSLHTVIESSWHMLPTAEQTLFTALAVFRGGFTRTAAQEVTGATLSQLMALVDRSFLRLDGDQRYRRHPLLLQFAQKQLAAQPAKHTAVQAEHARFFTQFVHGREDRLQGAEAPATLSQLSADLDNIRAAWLWTLTSSAPRYDLAERMVSGLGRFYADRSRFLEGSDLFSHSLSLLPDPPHPPEVIIPLQVKLQLALGRFWHDSGRFAAGEEILHQALDLIDTHNLPTPLKVNGLHQLAIVVGDQGQRTTARTHLEEALALCEQTPPEQKIMVLSALGNLCTDDGLYEQARTHLQNAMPLAKMQGNPVRLATLHNNMGIIANRQKDYPEAIRQWQQARTLFQETGHRLGIANASFNIAMAQSGLGAYEEALQNIRQAYHMHEQLGHRRGMAGGQAVMGMIYREQREWRAARRHYYRSLRLSQEVGVRWVAMGVLTDVAEIDAQVGRLTRAARLLAFVVQDEAAPANTRTNAEALLQEVRAELRDAVWQEVHTAVAETTLGDLIEELVHKDPI